MTRWHWHEVGVEQLTELVSRRTSEHKERHGARERGRKRRRLTKKDAVGVRTRDARKSERRDIWQSSGSRLGQNSSSNNLRWQKLQYCLPCLCSPVCLPLFPGSNMKHVWFCWRRKGCSKTMFLQVPISHRHKQYWERADQRLYRDVWCSNSHQLIWLMAKRGARRLNLGASSETAGVFSWTAIR